MAEYGIFSEDGCIAALGSMEEADARCAEYRAEGTRVWWRILCPHHRGQPRRECKGCSDGASADGPERYTQDGREPTLEEYAEASRIVDSLMPGRRN